MNLESPNTLLPTNTSDERGATTSPAVVWTPAVDSSTPAQGLDQNTSELWGATPEKLAKVEFGNIQHMYSDAFKTLFTVYPPPNEVGSRGKNRFALIIATGYEGPNGLGWSPVPGAASDVRYWTSLLPPRGFKCDYLWDGLEDPSGHPTRENILRLIPRIAQCAEPGDEIILVFSGHGNESAYIPMGCPVNYTREAVVPDDLRASFIKHLKPGVAVLVVWDTCKAANPFALSQRLDLRDDRIVFEPTKSPQNGTNHSMIVLSASSGTTYEAKLSNGPKKVQCGSLCWAAFAFLWTHRRDPAKPEEILKQLMKYIRSTCKEEVIPQFLSSARGPDVPPEVLDLLNCLFTAYHPHAPAHPTAEGDSH